MDELLRCPFCGKPPVTNPFGEGGKGLMIECLTEGCVNPHTSYYDHASAIRVWNTRAASGGDSASLEQRARELLKAAWERAGWPEEAASVLSTGNDTQMMVVLSAITAAIANQQGVDADASRDAAYFRWLTQGQNFRVSADLMAADQYATLRRLCESLVPLDAASTHPVGDVGPEGAP